MERKELTTAGCRNLASAIIRAHIIDYLEVFRLHRMGRCTFRRLNHEREVFHTEWFKFLFLCLGFEGDDEAIDYYIERIEGRK